MLASRRSAEAAFVCQQSAQTFTDGSCQRNAQLLVAVILILGTSNLETSFFFWYDDYWQLRMEFRKKFHWQIPLSLLAPIKVLTSLLWDYQLVLPNNYCDICAKRMRKACVIHKKPTSKFSFQTEWHFAVPSCLWSSPLFWTLLSNPLRGIRVTQARVMLLKNR